jgi:hypothetical protein
MVRSTWMAMVIGLVVGPASGWAEDAYPIRIKEPARGTTALVQSRSTLRTEVKGEAPEGKTVVEEVRKEEKTEVYRQTVLEIPPGQKSPSRLRRQYDRAERKVGDKTTTFPYQNKSVLIEKIKEGQFRFSIERGPELVGDDADSLDSEFNGASADQWRCQTAFLPGKAVRVGESWRFDPAPMLPRPKGDKGLGFDVARAEATAKLLRVYRKDGRQFGVVETWVEVPIKEVKYGGYKLTVLDGKLIWSSTSDFCMDSSANISASETWMQLDCRAQLDLGLGPKAVLSIKGLIKGQTTWQETPR